MIITRRTIIAALPLTGFAAMPARTVEPEINPHERVRQDAHALAASMRALHGGHWRVAVNHDTPMVVILPEV